MLLQLPGEPSRPMIGNAGQSGRSNQIRPKVNHTSVTNLKILCNFTDKTLEGKFADEELRRLLVPTDLTKSDGTGTETMGLLDTTSTLREKSVSKMRKVRRFHILPVRSYGLQTWRPIVYEGPCLFTSQLEFLVEKKEYIPPVDLRAVCLVRAIANQKDDGTK